MEGAREGEREERGWEEVMEEGKKEEEREGRGWEELMEEGKKEEERVCGLSSLDQVEPQQSSYYYRLHIHLVWYCFTIK